MLFLLTKEPRLVDAEDVPANFLVRQSNDAVKYLLLEYNPNGPRDTDNIDVLKTQRRGEIRYLPFVTTIESITEDNKHSRIFRPDYLDGCSSVPHPA